MRKWGQMQRTGVHASPGRATLFSTYLAENVYTTSICVILINIIFLLKETYQAFFSHIQIIQYKVEQQCFQRFCHCSFAHVLSLIFFLFLTCSFECWLINLSLSWLPFSPVCSVIVLFPSVSPPTPLFRPVHISQSITGNTTWSCQSCCTASGSPFPHG